MIQNYTVTFQQPFQFNVVDACASDPFSSQFYCLGERLVKPAIDCCCRTTSNIIRCTQNIFEQFFENEECSPSEKIFCVPSVPSFLNQIEELNQLKGEINSLEIELAETFYDCHEIINHLQNNFAQKIQQAEENAQQIILDKIIHSIQTDDFSYQEAAKLFTINLLTNTLDSNFDLLSRLNTHFPLKARNNPFREMMIDNLWLALARAYLEKGNLDMPKKILLEHQGTENSRLRLRGASLALLKEITKKYFELGDIQGVKATINGMEKRSIDLDPDYVTDEVISFSVIRCIELGLIEDAIDLSAMKPIPNDQGDILLTAIRLCLSNGQLDHAITLAAAIPEADVLGNIYPRSSLELPLTWHRDTAQEMITSHMKQ